MHEPDEESTIAKTFNALARNAIEKLRTPKILVDAADEDLDADLQINVENWLAKTETKNLLTVLKHNLEHGGSRKELGFVTHITGGDTVHYMSQHGVAGGFLIIPGDSKFAHLPQEGLKPGNIIICEADVMDIVSVKVARFKPEIERRVIKRFKEILRNLENTSD